MLFFEELRDEFLEDPEFRAFYEQECHICANTMALVSRVAEMGETGQSLLNRLGISRKAFRELAEGDHCDPESVAGLAKALEMDRPGMFEGCPRLAGKLTRQEGRDNGGR